MSYHAIEKILAKRWVLMEIDLELLKHLITKHTDRIQEKVDGTGYLARTVVGVGIFLLDHEGNLDLLTAKQKVTFDRFLRPLLDEYRRSP